MGRDRDAAQRTDVDVVVVGAGFAGLTAARELTRAGHSVTVLEARDEVGGRARSTRLAPGETADLGAEWVGAGHRRVLALAAELALRPVPAGNLGASVLWRLPERASVGRLPPRGTRADLCRVLVAAGWQARDLEPSAPWSSRRATRFDAISLRDWVDELHVGEDATYLLERLVGSLASARLDAFSALHFLWWTRLAGGPVRSLRTTFQYRFREGAQELARRIAAQLPDVRLGTPAVRLEHDRDAVRVLTESGAVHARRAVVSVPVSQAHRVDFAPRILQLDEEASLQVGPGTKVTALLPESIPVRHHTVVGGDVLAAAWRSGRRVTGFANLGSVASSAALCADLAEAFGVAPEQLSRARVCSWAEEQFIPGCDLALRPGEVTGIARRLRLTHGPIVFAGAERSSWPNNLEGAVESGHAAARAIGRRGR